VLRERNGAVFEGDFVRGEARTGPGIGRQTYGDGSWYEGPWRAGMRHGRGTYRRPAAASSKVQSVANQDTSKKENLDSSQPSQPEDTAANINGLREEADGVEGGDGPSSMKGVGSALSSEAGGGGGAYEYVGEWEQNAQSGVGREHAGDGTDYQGEVRAGCQP
jgi:hypothetical protein